MTLEKFGHAGLITRDEAKAIRDAMKHNRGLAVANSILDGCGVEVIVLPDGCFDRCLSPEMTIRYVNLGDTYDRTLLRVNGQYRVGDWGSIMEQYH